MGFKNGNPGCPCCQCNWTFTVKGCNNTLQSGATVNLRQSGSLIGTGTTNSSGVVVISVPAGTYDVEVIGSAGYATNTSTTAHTCDQATTITLAADSDHVCRSSCGCPLAPTSIALTFSTGSGPSDTLAYRQERGGIGGYHWFGSTVFDLTGSGDFAIWRLNCESGTSAYSLRPVNSTTDGPYSGGDYGTNVNATCSPTFSMGPVTGGIRGTWTAV